MRGGGETVFPAVAEIVFDKERTVSGDVGVLKFSVKRA